MTKLMSNIIKGMGSVLAVYPSARDKDPSSHFSGARSTKEALRSDWEKLGGDLRHSFDRADKFLTITTHGKK